MSPLLKLRAGAVAIMAVALRQLPVSVPAGAGRAVAHPVPVAEQDHAPDHLPLPAVAVHTVPAILAIIVRAAVEAISPVAVHTVPAIRATTVPEAVTHIVPEVPAIPAITAPAMVEVIVPADRVLPVAPAITVPAVVEVIVPADPPIVLRLPRLLPLLRVPDPTDITDPVRPT